MELPIDDGALVEEAVVVVEGMLVRTSAGAGTFGT